MTPKLTLEGAQASMKPLTDFTISKNLTSMSTSLPLATNVSTIPGFYSFFTSTGGVLQDASSAGAALSSRLVSSKYFEPENQSATTNTIYDILLILGLSTQILPTHCSFVLRVIRLIPCQRTNLADPVLPL
jgi:hypothetical protein